MGSYTPSWYVPLHRAAKDIADRQDRTLREVELWLCEQVELGVVNLIFLDKHERECQIRLSQWRRGGMHAVQRGTLYDHSPDRMPAKLRVFIHEERLASILPPKSLDTERKLPPSLPDLKKFLFKCADGNKSERECRLAAEQHFDRAISDGDRWRDAWKSLPSEKKRSRGAPRRKSGS